MFIGLLKSIVDDSNHRKCISLSNQKCEIQPSLINLHLMNTVKKFTAIHFRLNYIVALEVVILLMTYLIKFVFQIKQTI